MKSEPCPWCKRLIEVTTYGRKIPCPHCRKPVDIFPDFNLWLSTPFGDIGVNLEQAIAILGLLRGEIYK